MHTMDAQVQAHVYARKAQLDHNLSVVCCVLALDGIPRMEHPTSQGRDGDGALHDTLTCSRPL